MRGDASSHGLYSIVNKRLSEATSFMSIDDVFAIDMAILFLLYPYVPFLMFITVVFGYLTT